MTFIILMLAMVATFIFLIEKRKKSRKLIEETIPTVDFGDDSDELDIVHISDIHYLAPSLTDYGDAFSQNVEKGDGKMVRYIDQVMDSFILEMIKKKPKAVIVGGDITYNGEKISHQNMAKKFKILKDKNIDVLVIPGNHDINNEKAKSFKNKEDLSVESVNEEEFKEIYSNFGYSDEDPKVIARDKNSLSYMYMINKFQCILMIETSCGKNDLQLSNQTYKWIERMLHIASINNLSVISVTHQNILAHNKMFISGYKIENSSKLIKLFSDHNIRLNLSGHMHMQHISENEGVSDAAVGSIALYPSLYACIHTDVRDNIKYKTESLDVDYWAQKYGWKDDNLLHFKDKSKDFFIECTRYQTNPTLDKVNTTLEEKREMMDFMIDTNLYYFSGRMGEREDLNKDNTNYKKWKKYCEDTFLMSYLNSIYEDSSRSHNKLEISM
ncbi:MAG: metallophosphoesterase [Peptostreptococcus sp.]|uniref:metallophosphoesterase n=1 Tax=Peptostreptococcus sp. TaxID=1262 RepID=UPI002FC97CA6